MKPQLRPISAIGWVVVAAVSASFTLSALAGNWNVPMAARDIKNPVPGTTQTAHQGTRIYSAHCADCHGEDGRGNGSQQRVEYSLQSILKVPSQPGNKLLSDGELYWKITHGIGKMPSFAGILTDRERWLMVNHIRNLPDDESP